MNHELKPCPFCGSADLDLSNGYDEDANWVVVCRSCKASGTFCTEKPRAIERWNSRANLVSSAAVPKIYADGFCAHCSELAYSLTRALEATGVPTGETNWQRSYGPNKVRALSDHESSLRRLLRVLKEGKPEDLKEAIQNAEFYIEFHAAIRRRLTALAQRQCESLNVAAPAPSEDGAPLVTQTLSREVAHSFYASPLSEDGAGAAAREIVPDCLSRTCFIKDCGYIHCWGCDDSKQERERVTAIISKHCSADDAEKQCAWTYDPDGYWQTSCGDQFQISYGTPAENNMRFCHYCGLRIEESK